MATQQPQPPVKINALAQGSVRADAENRELLSKLPPVTIGSTPLIPALPSFVPNPGVYRSLPVSARM